MEEETRRFLYTIRTKGRRHTVKLFQQSGIGEFKRHFPKHHDFDREPIIRHQNRDKIQHFLTKSTFGR